VKDAFDFIKRIEKIRHLFRQRRQRGAKGNFRKMPTCTKFHQNRNTVEKTQEKSSLNKKKKKENQQGTRGGGSFD